jgi:predicted DNA-binding transcriptional regulator YafY
MERAQNKATRLIQIESLLLAHPEGMTQAEIARRLQVNRSTINRYIPDLPKHIYIELDGCWKIDRTADLINVRLNLHEALAVHLAARLLATRMDRQNPHAASALRKIGIAMERWAARISQHVLQSADVMDEAAQRHDPVYLQALEKLTLAWAEQRKVQIWHRKEANGAVNMHVFSPYFIEPYAVGQTTHVIGFSDNRSAVRTFKIERIERVEMLLETYAIPEAFDPRDLLADAWGIWYTDCEPVEIVLKFHPRVSQRVKETRWHRSQQLEELSDGFLLWRGWVAEPREMLNWIRGWGADCEVVEPESLREAVRDEAQRLMAIYG